MPQNSQSIEQLAYELWSARGKPHGSAEEDWLKAQQQLSGDAVDEASLESFPASDAPSSHLPDVPPSNAGDQWKAAARRSGSDIATEPPVDESDDNPATAPGDIGEG